MEQPGSAGVSCGQLEHRVPGELGHREGESSDERSWAPGERG